MSGAVAHQISLAVWEVPAAVPAGERYAVKIGAKSSAGSPLAGSRIEVLDDGGNVLAHGRLGETPWPGTNALFWSEVELYAPSVAGITTLAVRFDATALDEPQHTAPSTFTVAVVTPPDHVLTVTVAAEGEPLADAIVRAGPIRATTDTAGRARLHLAKGRHELAVWKAGYDIAPTPLTIDADAAITVTAHLTPEDNPDARWTA